MSNKKLKLKNVTLCAMTSVNVYETVQALKYSMRDIEFGDVVFISHKKPFYLPKDIRFSYTSILDSIDKFNYKMTYELCEHIKTDYALIVHADGFVVNPDSWQDEFLDYDYIGSPWPLPKNDYEYRDKKGNICRVGNSVSIRSMKLMRYPADNNVKWEKVYDDRYNEDIFICCHIKNQMEEAGIKWAPFELAAHFGRENTFPENKDLAPFVFHKWNDANSSFPRFYSPKKRFKMAVRPFLFWRRSKKWKQAHGMDF